MAVRCGSVQLGIDPHPPLRLHPTPHPQAARHAASLAAAAGQQAEVAMLCLERLISLGVWWVGNAGEALF